MSTTFYHTFPNGLRLVHRQADIPVAYVGVMVGAGTRDETPEESGLAHFIEHCAFKGTERLSALQLLRRVEDVGAELNAYTTKEETVFYAATPVKYTSRVVEVITDMILNPAFPAGEINKEKQVIVDEIESYNDSPSELIYDDFESLLFASHPLSQPILGTKKSLRSLNGEKAKTFMQRHYSPNRCVFFSFSPMSAKQIIAMVEKSWQVTSVYNPQVKTDAPVSLRTAPDEYKAEELNLRRHTHQVHVMLGSRAYPIGHPKQLSMFLLNNLLGGGSLSSRLNLALREKKGLVYTIESNYTPLSDSGYWSVYFATEADEREQCETLVLRELKTLREKPLSSAALQRAKVQLHGQMAISAANLENSALSMAKLMLYHNSAPTWKDTFREIDKLTAADLFHCANEVFVENKISLLRYL